MRIIQIPAYLISQNQIRSFERPAYTQKDILIRQKRPQMQSTMDTCIQIHADHTNPCISRKIKFAQKRPTYTQKDILIRQKRPQMHINKTKETSNTHVYKKRHINKTKETSNAEHRRHVHTNPCVSRKIRWR